MGPGTNIRTTSCCFAVVAYDRFGGSGRGSGGGRVRRGGAAESSAP